MKKQRRIMMVMGVAVLAVALSRCSPHRTDQANEGQVPAVNEAGPDQTEGQAAVEEGASEALETPIRESQDQADTQALEAQADETDAEKSDEAARKGSEGIQEPGEAALAEPVATPEAELQAPIVEEEASDQSETSMSTDEVDAMENALSASDYAKGLSLLAQLPAETIDRFVELRKEGFTEEEQAEVKSILLASYEGEDLEWIVEVYHKLQAEKE